MSSWFREIANRLTAVALILLVASGAIQFFFSTANAQNVLPLFSVTLIVPNNNLVRVQYASMIADNMVKLGIDAKVEYENLSTVENRLFTNSTGPLFNEGGYDIAFIAWSFGIPLQTP